MGSGAGADNLPNAAGVSGPRALSKVRALFAKMGAARGWDRRMLAAAAGGFSVLSMAPVFLWPVLFLTLPVLIALLDRPVPGIPRWRSAAIDGWWFGFGYHFLGLFWIGEAFLVEAHIFGWLMPFAITIMPAGLAIFAGLACAGASAVWRPGPSRLLVLAIAVSIAEYARGHVFTGFPWNILGYALTTDSVAMQSASVFGIYGLSAIAVVVFAAPLTLAAEARGWPHALGGVLALSAGPLAAIYAYGLAVLPASAIPVIEGVTVRIVQPSVPQHDKWSRDKQGAIFDDHVTLTATNEDGESDGAAGITHVVWPEAAMPFLPLSNPQALSRIGETLPDGVHLIAGALRLDSVQAGDELKPGVRPDRKIYNSMLVLGPEGELVTLYDKLHLVPFGEYLPFADTLNAIGLQTITRIRGGFSIGPSPRPLLKVPGLPAAGPLICYEAIFPAAVVQGAQRPGLLINVTNDGWFGNLTGPYQHFHQSRVRAVEEGLSLVRAGNNGVSALIDPHGRVVDSLALNVRGVLDVQVPQPILPTYYARYGNGCFVALIALLALAAGGMLAYPWQAEHVRSIPVTPDISRENEND